LSERLRRQHILGVALPGSHRERSGATAAVNQSQ
jgi:hypothetical protein